MALMVRMGTYRDYWNGIIFPTLELGILPSAIGIDKSIQQNIFANAGFVRPKREIISREDWKSTLNKGDILERHIAQIGLPFVIKPPRQGSSLGISVIYQKDIDSFTKAVDKAFFIQEITSIYWLKLNDNEKIHFIHELLDIRLGIGLPVWVENEIIHHPEDLLIYLNRKLKLLDKVILETVDGEEEVLFESFIGGKEFSCIVIEDVNGGQIALPPTEVVKHQSIFDYRSKYLPGMSSKITPI